MLEGQIKMRCSHHLSWSLFIHRVFFFSRSLLVRGLCPRLPASVAVCPGQAQGPAYYSAGARDTVQVTCYNIQCLEITHIFCCLTQVWAFVIQNKINFIL